MVFCNGQWNDVVSGTRIDPPFVKIGPELVSVGQLVATVMMYACIATSYNT